MSRVLGTCSLYQHRLRSRTPRRRRIRVRHAPAVAVAWSSSRPFSVRLSRVRHRHRVPLPGRRCRDPARCTSTCRRSHGASATGWTCARVNRHCHASAGDSQFAWSAVAASRQCHPREPPFPSGNAGSWQLEITAPLTQPHQSLQIPITSRTCPAGSCLGGFRTPAPCLTRHLRGPASENLHQTGHRGPPFWIARKPEAFINLPIIIAIYAEKC